LQPKILPTALIDGRAAVWGGIAELFGGPLHTKRSDATNDDHVYDKEIRDEEGQCNRAYAYSYLCKRELHSRHVWCNAFW
jgi:hypothetical protein